jgi:hypothetical protein
MKRHKINTLRKSASSWSLTRIHTTVPVKFYLLFVADGEMEFTA